MKRIFLILGTLSSLCKQIKSTNERLYNVNEIVISLFLRGIYLIGGQDTVLTKSRRNSSVTSDFLMYLNLLHININYNSEAVCLLSQILLLTV